MENNVTALQWFLYFFIIMSNTVFLSIISKSASTQPIGSVISHQEASFCGAPECFLVISFLKCHFPSWGRRLGGDREGTLQTLQCRRCPPSISSQPSFNPAPLGLLHVTRACTPCSGREVTVAPLPSLPFSPRTRPCGAQGGDSAALHDLRDHREASIDSSQG